MYKWFSWCVCMALWLIQFSTYLWEPVICVQQVVQFHAFNSSQNSLSNDVLRYKFCDYSIHFDKIYIRWSLKGMRVSCHDGGSERVCRKQSSPHGKHTLQTITPPPYTLPHITLTPPTWGRGNSEPHPLRRCHACMRRRKLECVNKLMKRWTFSCISYCISSYKN